MLIATEIINMSLAGDLGKAQIRLFWSSDSISKAIVPSAVLFYNRHVASSPYTGAYTRSTIIKI